MSEVNAFLTAAQRLKAWCLEEALPLWSENGVAPDGGFWERLDEQGKPRHALDRRYRVQCRQCVVFAEAALRQWSEDARAIAEAGLSFTLSKADFTARGGEGFSGGPFVLTDEGGVADPKPDLYTHAFLLLALSQYARLGHEDEAIACADELIAFITTKMASSHGGWVESLPPALPRRQNPHMHLFEASLAMAEATGLQRYREIADRIAGLFECFFKRDDPTALLEFFTDDWAPDSVAGTTVEPGHMMEWVWLLDRHERLCGARHGETIGAFYNAANTVGRHDKTGNLVDAIKLGGDPLDGRQRSWPLTEAIKAGLVLCRRGDTTVLPSIIGDIERLMDGYLGGDAPVRGGWIDRYDSKGKALDDVNSASTFYHLMGAVAEVDDYARSLTQP
ncbi:MAG: AGE family epimerase/isomerase [Pseudomonadota bacterium]